MGIGDHITSTRVGGCRIEKVCLKHVSNLYCAKPVNLNLLKLNQHLSKLKTRTVTYSLPSV